MTYRLSEDGRQFVVIAAGGHGRLGTTIGDSVVAFALPETGTDLLVKTIIEVLIVGIVVLVIVFLLLRGRRVLLNRWLWLFVLAVGVILSTEIRWMLTQSASAVAVWFVLALLTAYLLIRARSYLETRFGY